MLKEFKEFAIKGNMIDMAVGIIIGGAFNSLVSTLVNDVIMPLLSVLTGKIDFSNIFFAMDGKHYDTLSAVPEGVATVNIGVFISGVINFIIMAFVVFMIVKMIKGPSVFDRMNGLSVISANVLIMILVYGFLDGRPEMFIDIAIAYSILGFVTNIVVAKYVGRKKNAGDS